MTCPYTDADDTAAMALLPHISLRNAPRNIHELAALPRVIRWRIANELGFPNEVVKEEYKNAGAFIQAHMLRDTLKAYDKWRRDMREHEKK